MRAAIADVLVVGAGPAGSVAALVLARAGARVRILDRAVFPRDKLCGDTLNPGALARLDELGVGAAVRAHSLPVAGMIVTGPGGARIVGRYDDTVRGAAIKRRSLDRLLLDAAVAAGAQFEPDAEVRGPLMAAGRQRVEGVRLAAPNGERALRAHVVVGADGRHSRLAFDLGLAAYAPPRRWAFGTYYSDVDALTDCGEMHIRGDGYIGVAPLADGLTNVCVVRELGASRRERHVAADSVVQEAIDRDPALRDRFAHARRATAVTVLGPLAVEARAAGIPGLLLAGDAAGFIDPMTGDGLRFAIRGAELAAEYAARELATGRAMHHELAAARRREFAAKWRMNRALRALVSAPRAVRAAESLASIWQAPVRMLVARAGDCP